jgi:sugar phosphate isomerase/epimerase
MKFAFSTVACPTWDFQTVAARAKEYGYDGVEIRGFLNESLLTAANVFLSDPAKVGEIFRGAGVEIACLASSIAMTGKRSADAAAAADMRKFVDTAKGIGCRIVKIFDTQVRPGQDRSAAAVALGQWLLPLGDYAAERGITLVIENALSFRNAKEMWMVLETINHPAVCACWDVFNAALVGESPFLSVPTLNSRIQYTQVKDAKLTALGATLCPLGAGDVPVQKFLTRMRGIGYEGYVALEWEKAWLPNIAPPEEILPQAIGKLKEWTEPAEGEGDAKPKAGAKGKAKEAAATH